jgi:predicted aspartyl protease
VQVSSLKQSVWLPATALVDSGADRTVIPQQFVDALELPEVAVLEFEVGGGGVVSLSVYRIWLKVGELEPMVVEVAASAGEEVVLLGRDVLNEFLTVLDGPQMHVTIA